MLRKCRISLLLRPISVIVCDQTPQLCSVLLPVQARVLNTMSTLLVIEDSTEDVGLILSATDTLLPREHAVVADTGEAAVDYLFGTDGNGMAAAVPKLVLLDMHLPGISGLEVLRLIRSSPSHSLVPVIAFSASVDPADVRAATLAGANSYIRKSLDHARLSDAVKAVVQYWLELNIAPPSRVGGAIFA